MQILDCETIARAEGLALLGPVSAPKNLKDPAKIKAALEEREAERLEKAALDPNTCLIVAMAMKGSQGDEWTWTADTGPEAEAIQHVWEQAKGHAILGFNIGFDLRVLTRRSQLLAIHHPRLELGKYRHPGVIDLLQELTFDWQDTWYSLGMYCALFGIPHDDRVKGADIPALVAAGDWKTVRAHVLDDVTSTYLLAQRLGYIGR